jgi:hypothetical protein
LKSILIFAFCGLIFGSGCESIQKLTNRNISESSDRQTREQMLDQMIGNSEEQIVGEFGIPSQVYTNGAVKIMEYKESYGAASRGFYGDYSGYAKTNEVFDKVTFFLKDGKMTKWTARKQN